VQHWLLHKWRIPSPSGACIPNLIRVFAHCPRPGAPKNYPKPVIPEEYNIGVLKAEETAIRESDLAAFKKAMETK
jgi:hypothetical protein